MEPRVLSIVGVGLLGGSIGLAARAAISGVRVHGYGHRQATLDRATEIGAIDRGFTDLAAAVREADLTILCTPVGILGETLERMGPVLKGGAVVTDVGSTKESVVRAAGKFLPRSARFIGSHPMAGSEKRGVEFARTDLFQGALCIVTPDEQTDEAALAGVESFWRLLGMRTCRMGPAEHDRALAEVSHLPHAVAAALVAMQSPDALKLAGKGFLDATRIAGGDGNLWRDIFRDNAPNVRAALANLRGHLAAFERLLEPGNEQALADWLDRQAGVRGDLLREKLREITPD